jgi:hypothetical protein
VASQSLASRQALGRSPHTVEVVGLESSMIQSPGSGSTVSLGSSSQWRRSRAPISHSQGPSFEPGPGGGLWTQQRTRPLMDHRLPTLWTTWPSISHRRPTFGCRGFSLRSPRFAAGLTGLEPSHDEAWRGKRTLPPGWTAPKFHDLRDILGRRPPVRLFTGP